MRLTFAIRFIGIYCFRRTNAIRKMYLSNLSLSTIYIIQDFDYFKKHSLLFKKFQINNSNHTLSWYKYKRKNLNPSITLTIGNFANCCGIDNGSTWLRSYIKSLMNVFHRSAEPCHQQDSYWILRREKTKLLLKQNRRASVKLTSLFRFP